jgi:hypothetical protein
MDNLFGYGSDSGGEESEPQEETSQQKPAGTTTTKGLLGMLPPARGNDDPPAKKQKRTLDIGKFAASRPQGSDSDDEEKDQSVPASRPKGSGLLSFVSVLATPCAQAYINSTHMHAFQHFIAHQKNITQQVLTIATTHIISQLPAPKRETSSTAYEDALARKEKDKPTGEGGPKKLSKAAMASALFEKQRQEKAAAKALASEEAASGHAGGNGNDHQAQQVKSVRIFMMVAGKGCFL